MSEGKGEMKDIYKVSKLEALKQGASKAGDDKEWNDPGKITGKDN